jgi:hypothetical protein
MIDVEDAIHGRLGALCKGCGAKGECDNVFDALLYELDRKGIGSLAYTTTDVRVIFFLLLIDIDS